MFVLDKSRIPPEKLSDPRLAILEKGVLKAMEDDGWRLRRCLHEAAHAIYLRRAGARDVFFYGPSVSYYSETDEFDVGDVAVAGDFGSGSNCDSMDVARWHAAGGVARRILTNDEPGDETDLKDFSAWAKRIGLTQQQIDEHWHRAQIEVEKDLRSPAFRRELWELAKSYKQILDSGAYQTGLTPGEMASSRINFFDCLATSSSSGHPCGSGGVGWTRGL